MIQARQMSASHLLTLALALLMVSFLLPLCQAAETSGHNLQARQLSSPLPVCVVADSWVSSTRGSSVASSSLAYAMQFVVRACTLSRSPWTPPVPAGAR